MKLKHKATVRYATTAKQVALPTKIKKSYFVYRKDAIQIQTKQRKACTNLTTLKGVVFDSNWKPKMQFMRQHTAPS